MSETVVVLILLAALTGLAQLLARVYRLRRENLWLSEQLQAFTHEAFRLREHNRWLEQRLDDLTDTAERAAADHHGARRQLGDLVSEIRREAEHRGLGGHSRSPEPRPGWRVVGGADRAPND